MEEGKLLDPKLDVVFKMLFADERNRHSLTSLLTAILEPSAPISGLEILNAAPPKEDVSRKGIILDVRAQLLDKTVIDVEMQPWPHLRLPERALFYWAENYQLGMGKKYTELVPVVSIFILNFIELSTTRFHSVFQIQEIQEHVSLTDHLTMHFLELPKLPKGPPVADDPLVIKWGKFFAAKTPEELDQVAMTDPNIQQAKLALEQLSADPTARALARDRKLAEWNYQRDLDLAREEGIEKGREEGVEKGLREAVAHLCQLFGIELTEPRQARLASSSLENLQKLHDSIAVSRSWPDA